MGGSREGCSVPRSPLAQGLRNGAQTQAGDPAVIRATLALPRPPPPVRLIAATAEAQ